MCGFVGLFTASRDAPVRLEGLDGALRSIVHRGPDGDGRVLGAGAAFAACRLAVQGDERAAQPAESRDGRIAMVFNGELLDGARARLRQLVEAARREAPPEAAGDVPLLVETVAALASGLGALQGGHLSQLLEGSMGALAVLDREADEVWLARDRLGIKPLYTADVGDRQLFASEIRALLALAPELRRADGDGLAELLHWQRPVRSLPFAGVESLAPGAVWRLRRGGRVTRWVGGRGVRDLVPNEPADPVAAVERLREALAHSAREAAATGADASLFLSGGLDSGAVALYAGREDLLALTGRYAPGGGELDESGGAAAVAAAAPVRHEIVDLRDGDLLDDLPAVVRALEVPMAGPGSLSLWRLARRARQHGRVVLTGTGGDELLGGYARTAIVLGRDGAWTEGYEALARRVQAAGTELAMRQREALDRVHDLRPLLHPDFLSELPAVEVPGAVARAGSAGEDPVRALVHEEIEGTLPMLLAVEDRVAMAHGLEGRPVLCLGDVPAAAAALPPDWLVGPDGEGKRALRHLLDGRMPDAVRTDRRKRGFPTPFARAVRGVAREAASAVLADRRFVERGWWDVDACRRALADDRATYDRALFACLSWEFWARAFLDGDAFPPERTT